MKSKVIITYLAEYNALVAFGTAAEETNGFKVDMGAKGAFNNIGVATKPETGFNVLDAAINIEFYMKGK